MLPEVVNARIYMVSLKRSDFFIDSAKGAYQWRALGRLFRFRQCIDVGI
jgi:hypothetical protein